MSSQADPSLSASRKRSHDGELISTLPIQASNSAVECPTSTPVRASSPAISISSSGSALTDLTPSIGKSPAPTNVGGSAQKKSKLTFAEREVENAVKRREKEERERQRAEDKARKEQEKREKAEEKEAAKQQRELEKAHRDVEKAKKDAERAEKQKAKDTEKAAKDAEKATKEAEKLKKERAQLRLGNFFQKPVQASTPPSITEDVSSGVSSRRSSITSIDADMPDAELKSTRPIPPGFRKWFLPFCVAEDMELAPANRFITSQTLDLSNVDRLLEADRKSHDLEQPQVLMQTLKGYHRRARKGKRAVPVKKLVERIYGTEDASIDLTSEGAAAAPRQLLASVPMKVLSYSVDVRPPYQGTFTRLVSPRSTRKISRRPHTRLLPDINYDYDSEGEWEPPEEGDEDLNSEDEEGSIDNEDEEMGDFLDDEDDVAKRRMIVGDVEAVSTGLCWQGEDPSGAAETSMKQYHIDVLDDAQLPFPIDPFSTRYWSKPSKAPPIKVEKEASTVAGTTMQPPRLPLATVSPNKTLLIGQGGFVSASILPLVDQNGENASMPIPKKYPKASDSNKPLRLINPDLLPEFKQTVEGSDLTKIALIERLKKQFPKVAKDMIKDTLGAVAERTGKKADDKWILLQMN